MTQLLSFRRAIALVTATVAVGSVMILPGALPAAAATMPTVKWTVNTPGIIDESSPMVANLNGQNDVVVGSRDGKVYSLNGSDGSNVAGWPFQTGDPIDATPAIADTNGDGSQDVFIGSGYGGVRSGNLFAINANGTQRWKFHPSDNDFPSLSMYSSPALGDVNGDGVADVSAFSLGLLGWSFSADGAMNKGWPFYQDDTTFASPAIYDVDGDGKQDYVVAGDSSPGGPVDHRGGFIRAIRGDGSLIWAFPMDEMGHSSPVIGDIDGDGKPEIVAGSGDYWVRQPGGASDSTKVFALNLNGSLKWSHDIQGYTDAAPALADVNGDGKLDVIESTWGGPQPGRIWVLDGATGNPISGWAGKLVDAGGILGQAVTADLNNDGAQDIIVNTGSGVYAFDGRTGAKIFTNGLNEGQDTYQNSVWVGDIDGNGKLDIITAGATPGANGHGIIQRWEMPDTTARLGANGWSQFRKDNAHTGSEYPTRLGTDFCSANPGQGYQAVASDGGVFSYCNAPFYGSMGGQALNSPVVGLTKRKQNDGYWEVASDGGIFSFGNAHFYGSTGSIKLNQPVVGMATTPSGNGYWLVARDGGIFAYGDAAFYGSMGGKPLNQPIVGMASTASGHGYWLTAADGGVFAFGDARFYGSTGNIKLNSPVVGMTATNSGNGYLFVAADGGVFAYGDAQFKGSEGGQRINSPVVGIAKSTNGYWLVGADGGIYAFNAPFLGSVGSIKLNKPVVGMGN